MLCQKIVGMKMAFLRFEFSKKLRFTSETYDECYVLQDETLIILW